MSRTTKKCSKKKTIKVSKTHPMQSRRLSLARSRRLSTIKAMLWMMQIRLQRVILRKSS